MSEAFEWPLEHLGAKAEPTLVRWSKLRAFDQPAHNRISIQQVYIEAGIITTCLKKKKVRVR